jgi:hypothetical protein
VGLSAQTEEELLPLQSNFKPHFSGASVNAGFMIMPGVGSGNFIAPKISFHATPRLFVNAGVTILQYNSLLSPKPASESTQRRTGPVIAAYVFTEGVYLLNEKWSINGSAMKYITSSGPFNQATPFRLPKEAMHLGVDYKITPNITVGAKIGYSNGSRGNSLYNQATPHFF